MKYLIYFFFFSSVQAATVHIRGKKIRNPQIITTGKKVVLSPKTSDTSITKIIDEIPSASISHTTSIGSSGSAPIRVRGHEGKYTEIWLNNILISDPFSSFSVIHDWDIEAFDRLELSYGVSDYDHPSMTTIGGIQYILDPTASDQLQLGSKYGQPYGTSHHIKYRKTHNSLSSQIFARQHQTRGKFRYYDDQATPFSPENGIFSTRENNDHQGIWLFPSFSYSTRRFLLQSIFSWQKRSGGLSGIAGEKSDLRFSHNIKQSMNSFTYKPKNMFIKSITMNSSWQSLRLKSYSPSQLAQSSEVQTKSLYTSAAMDIDFRTVNVRPKLSFFSSPVLVTNHFENADFLRQGNIFSLFLKTSTQPTFTYKGSIRSITDKKTNLSTCTKYPRSHAVSISTTQRQLKLYAQLGYFHRSPTLVEEYGDGGYTRGNSSLSFETIYHKEIGFQIKHLKNIWKLSGHIYHDRIDDRITLVASSFGRSIAKNVGTANLQGLESRLDLSWRDMKAALSAHAVDSSFVLYNQKRHLPHLARNVFTGQIGYQWKASYLALAIRHRGNTFRDLDNKLLIPKTTIVNMSYDIYWNKLSVGLNIENLTHVQKIPFESDRKGVTGYSEINGHPLPGRQATVHGIYNF